MTCIDSRPHLFGCREGETFINQLYCHLKNDTFKHEKANYVLWALIYYGALMLLASVKVELNGKLLESFFKEQTCISPTVEYNL